MYFTSNYAKCVGGLYHFYIPAFSMYNIMLYLNCSINFLFIVNEFYSQNCMIRFASIDLRAFKVI